MSSTRYDVMCVIAATTAAEGTVMIGRMSEGYHAQYGRGEATYQLMRLDTQQQLIDIWEMSEMRGLWKWYRHFVKVLLKTQQS